MVWFHHFNGKSTNKTKPNQTICLFQLGFIDFKFLGKIITKSNQMNDMIWFGQCGFIDLYFL